jgi:acetyltransferase-like isoleucine patch superfamily enzyme
MIKRDFSAESKINMMLRAARAISSRVRGYTYIAIGMFSEGSGKNITFGKNPRFINTKSMHLGSAVHFGICARLECYGGFAIDGTPKMKIGDGTSFGDYCHIGSFNSITIGKNVLGASKILIIDHNHGDPKFDIEACKLTTPRSRPLFSRGPIIIEDDVWIGEGVTILSGSRIGRGAIIAANSIVRGEVKGRTIYFGK